MPYYRRRRRGFFRRRFRRPMQWTTDDLTWGQIQTLTANVVTAVPLLSLPPAATSSSPPAIGRLKIERIQGRIHWAFGGGSADTQFIMIGTGLYVAQLTNAGAIANTWDPLLTNDQERNWIWHDVFVTETLGSGRVGMFSLPNGMLFNRKGRRNLRDGEALIWTSKYVSVFGGSPTLTRIIHTLRIGISRIA